MNPVDDWFWVKLIFLLVQTALLEELDAQKSIRFGGAWLVRVLVKESWLTTQCNQYSTQSLRVFLQIKGGNSLRVLGKHL